MLTFTPYHHWRWEHAIHHSTAGDLDRRGTGDVWTLTVQEYLESSRWLSVVMFSWGDLTRELLLAG